MNLNALNNVRKTIAIIVTVIAFIVGVVWYWLASTSHSIRQLDAKFSQIQQGMSTNEVTALLGPHGVWRTQDLVGWWDHRRLEESDQVRIRLGVRYAVETFILPVTFEVTFDANGKTVGRHRYD